MMQLPICIVVPTIQIAKDAQSDTCPKDIFFIAISDRSERLHGRMFRKIIMTDSARRFAVDYMSRSDHNLFVDTLASRVKKAQDYIAL